MRKLFRGLQRCPAPLRIVIFLAVVFLTASPFLVPLYRFEYEATDGQSVIWSPAFLFVVFILNLGIWGRWIHRLSSPMQTMGMDRSKQWWFLWATAFLGGAAAVAALYVIQLALGWGTWVPPMRIDLLRILLEGFGVALLVGLAEELLFRGWLLYELEQDYSPQVSLWLNAGLFALAHYVRPISVILETWPQFLGLLLLGIALVWARRIPLLHEKSNPPRTNLSIAAGLHSGLVWAYYQVDVADLFTPTNAVPEWVTGIGGNPLSGMLGITLLGAIAIPAYVLSHTKQSG